jgi:tetratricopeptide (TPR) repeat protein
MKLRAAVLLQLIFPLFLLSQKTAFYSDPEILFREGLELFDKAQYQAAQRAFSRLETNTRHQLLRADASFYSAACAIELFNKDGEWLMREFIRNYPASPLVNNGWLYLARSGFRKRKYKESLDHLNRIDIYRLDKEELAEYYFKHGYSSLQLGDEAKAKTDFYELKDTENRYTFPSLFYYSHISYKEKNYETALSGFRRLTDKPPFSGAAPYYITQIYFIQDKYSEVVKEAPGLLNDSSNIQKADEINRMIGESYFHMRDYGRAIPYLQKSNAGGAAGSYALGYSYYRTGDCKNAVTHFEHAVANDDSIAQNAWYHLADCYIKNGEKMKAKNAFYSAYQLRFDKTITEDALLGFAKLSYELDFSPFNEAVRAFTKYLKEYPDNRKQDEVYRYLINVYSTTKNYEQGVRSIEAMGAIDPVLKVTYQKLLYYRGVELFNNNDLNEAEKYFRKSLDQNSDPRLNAQNLYWLAEVQYIRRDYTTAIDTWKKFQVTEGAASLPEYDLSNYAIGYAFFHRKEKEDYYSANLSFRKFLLTKNTYDENKIADANIRTADCYFMNRDFIQAADYYSAAIKMNKLDVDYCLYQKALCDGLNKNYDSKVDELKKIESRYPKSNYLAASVNEIAETYYNNLRQPDNAIPYYEKLLSQFPNSSFANNSYAQLGNIYYERKQDDKAFEYYDKFVRRDSKSDAARDVLEAIRKILEAKGNVEEMEKYFASVGNPLTENQLEKSLYTTAYDAYYNQKNCDLAMQKWESYFTKYPAGRYVNEARFSYAECAYSKSMFPEALAQYRQVVMQARSLYTEVALSKAAYMTHKDKNYEEALGYYVQLQEVAETPANKSAGRLGAMRCAYQLAKYDVALEESNKVLATEKLSPQQLSEAKQIKARSLYETGRMEDALLEYRAITKSAKNVSGAEAYYYVGKIQFARQEYKEVEKTVSKLIGFEYSNEEWNNKAMLLLADAYIARNDLADAQVILESIIESTPKQEFLDEASKRLEVLKQKKAEAAVPKPDSPMKLEFNENKKDSALFKE